MFQFLARIRERMCYTLVYGGYICMMLVTNHPPPHFCLCIHDEDPELLFVSFTHAVTLCVYTFHIYMHQFFKWGYEGIADRHILALVGFMVS